MKLKNLGGTQIYVAELSLSIPPNSTVEIRDADVVSSRQLQELIRTGVLMSVPTIGYGDVGAILHNPAAHQDTRTQHSSLAGLDKDDHLKYPLVSGARGFVAPVEGRDPTRPEHLATLASVESAISMMYGVGDTAGRPVRPSAGFMYFDTDLGHPIWFDGTCWVDAIGTLVYCY